MKKALPTGVSNYPKLWAEDYYFIDKTLMIQEYLQRKSEVTLITRPRRFGKSLNMSMMAEFFDINKNTKQIFQNTKIAQTEYKNEMNQYPTIFLSFANCKGNYESVKKALFKCLRNEYGKHRKTFEEDKYDKNILEEVRGQYQAICKVESLSDINNAILILSEFLHDVYKKEVMIFIDEYDTPFIEAHVGGFYDEIKDDLSLLLQSSLKGNNCIKYAMLTGIQRVSKESVFSQLNNVKVFSVDNKAYAEYFGFTSEETRELLEYYDLELNDEVKAMYDGYNMGGTYIYNPWSIINYAEQKELLSFWINTSGNTMIKAAMKNCDKSFQTEFEKLIQDGFLNTQATLNTSFYEVQENSNLWGLFVNAGYLTIEEALPYNRVHLRIPNKEVREEFISLTAHYLKVSDSALTNMFAALLEKDMTAFLSQYRIILLDMTSYHDLKDENSYHMMMLGMSITLCDSYCILSNREVGTGRCDIILKSKLNQLPSFILEFKYTRTQTNLKQLAMKATEQIKERKYDHDLQGEVIYIGLAHQGKEVEMSWVEV